MFPSSWMSNLHKSVFQGHNKIWGVVMNYTIPSPLANFFCEGLW